ncbi:steroid 21-hydroxylase isoform X2 [Hippocampus zosterae]|uniref:steroid 21-hydroxylase isoform X2 n=1 Tax=Hippocampus zosterae TaxID=109293 RepID=UPI00223E3029|nr:steroid 21-hydroxylase isoform X2 [Hippocampus zosterae]
MQMRDALDHYKWGEKFDETRFEEEQHHRRHKMPSEVVVFTVAAALLMLVFALLQTFFKSATSNDSQCPKGKTPPGPASSFLIGNMMELTHDHLPIHLTQLAQRYGRIYQLKCGNTCMVVLNSTEVIREALVKKWSDFAGRPLSFTGDVVSGGGRSISLGDYNNEWRAHRRLVHGALLRCCHDSLHGLIEKQGLHLCKVLKAYQGSAVDLSNDFTVAASNVITTLTFGKEYDKSSSELQELHNCLNEIVALWGSCWISALDSFPLLRRLPNPVFSHLMQEVTKRDNIIRKHLKDFKSQDNKPESIISRYFLQGLDTKNGVLLTDIHVHMATVDLLIGGTETTAALLNWTIAFLLHRPEVQNQVYEELCTVPEGHYPKYSERHKLPVLTALINEVLRLRPVAPLAVPHRAIRDSSIAGYYIPKNTVIIPNLFGAHHDPSVWTEPDSFKPERFLEGGGASPRALIPFGGGARLCLGESVAKIELFLFTAYLLRDFHFFPTDACLPDLRGVASVVLKVKAYKVIACPRPVHDN